MHNLINFFRYAIQNILLKEILQNALIDIIGINTIKEIPVEKVLDYHLGDIVYIGSDSYEISNIGIMNIQLYDLKFPLLGREMSIDDFERVIKEEPEQYLANTFLIEFSVSLVLHTIFNPSSFNSFM